MLKHNHVYFYQCQGVMALLEIEALDFIVYTEKVIFIENIKFLKEQWEKTILPKLTKFYFEHMQENIFQV